MTEGTGIFPAVTSVHTSDPPDHDRALARERDVRSCAAPRTACRRSRRPPVAPLAPSPSHFVQGLTPGSTSGSDPLAWPARTGRCRNTSRRLPRALRRPVRAAPARPPPEEAARAAEELAPPVVVKVDGPAHKSAAGGVVLGVESPAAAAAAADRLGGRVLVAEQAPAGTEAFCGITRDPDYGPVVAVGLGGVAVEALSLAAVRLAPLDLESARYLVARGARPARVASERRARDARGRGRARTPRRGPSRDRGECDVNPLILGATARSPSTRS